MTRLVRASRQSLTVGAVCATVVLAGVLLITSNLHPFAVPGSPSPPSGSPPSSASPRANSTRPPGGNATPAEGNPTPPSENASGPATGSSGDLALSLVPDASSYRLGEAVAFVLTITNVGTVNETITSGGCNPWLAVTNGTGAQVYNQTAGMCPMIVIVGALGPGGSWSRNMSWPQQTSLGQRVPPGSYRLTEYWNADLNSGLLSSTAVVEITAN